MVLSVALMEGVLTIENLTLFVVSEEGAELSSLLSNQLQLFLSKVVVSHAAGLLLVNMPGIAGVTNFPYSLVEIGIFDVLADEELVRIEQVVLLVLHGVLVPVEDDWVLLLLCHLHEHVVELLKQIDVQVEILSELGGVVLVGLILHHQGVRLQHEEHQHGSEGLIEVPHDH